MRTAIRFGCNLFAILTLQLSGCVVDTVWSDSVQDMTEELPLDRNFASPEGVIVYKDRVFVCNANFAYQGSLLRYGPGFVTVLDRRDGKVLNRIALPFRNPQEMVVVDNRLWILCSGETGWNDDDSTVVAVTSGGLAAVDIDTADYADSPVETISLPVTPGALTGYPSGILVNGNMAWISSGTTAALFLADLSTGTLIHGADNPVVLAPKISQNTTVIGRGPQNTVVAGLFNDDSVMLLDMETGTRVDDPWNSGQVGTPGQMDGILDLEFDGENIYVLLGLANQVVVIDAFDGPDAGVFKLVGNLMSPNRMKLSGDELFVVNSGSNSVASVDTGSGESSGHDLVLPVGCNPWDIDIDERDGRRTAWVTCLKSDSVIRAAFDEPEVQEIK